ncbi:hypothetical protein Krac_6966 [Ktedonobacter racemifer DSM 44963]|uniref:Uncharacterized protein n=1 Tax=Ktedonobacter racemifer DSM 44963 TaxID=485913 RepID=D6TQ84_KTERA|nr:hypothetical protein Krac_6966 [Ktedonobacter racemifer DSM 44963]
MLKEITIRTHKALKRCSLLGLVQVQVTLCVRGSNRVISKLIAYVRHNFLGYE